MSNNAGMRSSMHARGFDVHDLEFGSRIQRNERLAFPIGPRASRGIRRAWHEAAFARANKF